VKHTIIFIISLFIAENHVFASPQTETEPTERRQGCSVEKAILVSTEKNTDMAHETDIDLTRLKQGEHYRLTCGIDAAADSTIRLMQHPSDLKALALSHHADDKVVLNHQTVQGNLNDGMTLSVKKGQNMLEMHYTKPNVATSVDLIFLNTHRDVATTIYSCSAKLVSRNRR
jgi:hypothetical protein